ncbi:Asp/Glu/hydantoin racemase [Pusillimonas sp. TS35]|uniref:aspartate/glutamate racemase family protein n=1 Tax=Paracandidimonas lactea TaxID=2895524 RepID=UPI0013721D1E|nr:aspartate/glutamate racemase family protein [Paracandidimonas lactea]MYN14784.1 Asp/Glu/hydantoin racemase [Pusillimonas sp. TS35]
MKLLVINPNISGSVTALIEAEARRAALPDTQLTLCTAQAGVAYIETPAEAVVAAYETFVLLARHHAGHDAAIVAAFGDPGVAQAREIMPMPVIGLTEAALANAFLLGGRFGIVGISERIGHWYQEVVQTLGMSDRFCGYRGLGQAFADVGTVHEEARDMLLQLCLQRVREGADSIILAGAPLAGLAREIEDRVPVPLIDGVGSAVRMAEAMARAGYRPRQAGSLAPPPCKDARNLEPSLAALIGRSNTLRESQ